MTTHTATQTDYIVDLDPNDRFSFDPTFMTYLQQQPYTFGFNGVGAALYYRSYANPLPNGGTEHWPDTILRAITGAVTTLKWHMLSQGLPWDEDYWNTYAMDMAKAAFDRKWLPAGRQIQHFGKELVYQKGAAFLLNCAALSVKRLSDDAYWLADMGLAGAGIGFSTYEYSETLQLPAEQTRVHVVGDTREGWAESIRALIQSYEQGSETIVFDYSEVRPAGSPIKSIGGVAPGPAPLERSHELLRVVLDQYAKGEISAVRVVVDVMNIVGMAIVSGGQRRVALIALGRPGDVEFNNLKNYGKRNRKGEIVEPGPAYDRIAWGWCSNNSIVLADPSDYEKLGEIADNIRVNGEPGVLNLMNMQKYGRFGEEKPDEASLINPCGEQPLEDKELCCLSEVYYMNCTSEKEFYKAIEYATAYASMVSLLPTHDAQSNVPMLKNRRIGVSLSGVGEAIQKEPKSQLIRKLRKGYDVAIQTNHEHARRCEVPASVRVTSVKPSGSTSLVAGSSPGLHFPMYSTYIRRMRVHNEHPILKRLADAGIPHEPDDYDPSATSFEFPVHLGNIRGQKDVSMWEKGELTALMQEHWSDNATSVTINFNKKREGHEVESFLQEYMPRLKSVSMLPEIDPEEDEVTYTQHPYEEISVEEYHKRIDAIRPIDWRNFEQESIEQERFCDGDACSIF